MRFLSFLVFIFRFYNALTSLHNSRQTKMFLLHPYNGIDTTKLIYSATVNSLMDCVHRCLQNANCQGGKYKQRLRDTVKNCKIFQKVNDEHDEKLGSESKDASFTIFQRKDEELESFKEWNSCQEYYTYSQSNADKRIVNLTGMGPHICKKEIKNCGLGGWTLAMKIHGSLKTFRYDATLWTDRSTYNVENCLKHAEGIREEGKFKAYSKMPFKKICLRMKAGGRRASILIPLHAPSLYSVMKYHRETSLTKSTWKSLLLNSSMQRNCNKQGFSTEAADASVRIGFISNQENDCASPDSVIGFGIKIFSKCLKKEVRISCGNVAHCEADNGDRIIPAVGYIYLQ